MLRPSLIFPVILAVNLAALPAGATGLASSRVVERGDGYNVIEKDEDVRPIAEATDPRT